MGCGCLCMAEALDRISFNKGYTEKGFAERGFHLRLGYEGDHDALYFRDYLLEHAEAAAAYEEMKRKLWKKMSFAEMRIQILKQLSSASAPKGPSRNTAMDIKIPFSHFISIGQAGGLDRSAAFSVFYKT